MGTSAKGWIRFVVLPFEQKDCMNKETNSPEL